MSTIAPSNSPNTSPIIDVNVTLKVKHPNKITPTFLPFRCKANDMAFGQIQNLAPATIWKVIEVRGLEAIRL